MKITHLYLSLVFSCLFIVSTDAHNQYIYPQLSFIYQGENKAIEAFIDTAGYECLIDHSSEQFLKDWQNFVIDEEIRLKFEQKLPIFFAEWNEQAPLLFGEIYSRFHQGFKHHKQTAIISLVVNGGYGSNKLLWLGLRFLIEDATKNCYDTNFILIFHELLHIWVDDNITGSSKLLTKYQHADEDTRDHIHLMALQKMVYTNLDMFDELAIIDHGYRYDAPSSYRHAWEIVNDIEGYEVVLQDIEERLTRDN
ncbi:hypothetical protein KBC04_05655 [Candidatus Babeliales bacterium]|nr:hypothetical protein [Candidatus Babeliales bacterium]MBP9844399.1 hypothetical protein [Candidatus Babeliales bacterium]